MIAGSGMSMTSGCSDSVCGAGGGDGAGEANGLGNAPARYATNAPIRVTALATAAACKYGAARFIAKPSGVHLSPILRDGFAGCSSRGRARYLLVTFQRPLGLLRAKRVSVSGGQFFQK